MIWEKGDTSSVNRELKQQCIRANDCRYCLPVEETWQQVHCARWMGKKRQQQQFDESCSVDDDGAKRGAVAFA